MLNTLQGLKAQVWSLNANPGLPLVSTMPYHTYTTDKDNNTSKCSLCVTLKLQAWKLKCG